MGCMPSGPEVVESPEVEDVDLEASVLLDEPSELLSLSLSLSWSLSLP